MSASRGSGGLRWAACFVLVLGAHAAAAASLLAHWQPVDAPVAGGPPILIELAPAAAAPAAPPSDAAPSPQQAQAAQPVAPPVEKADTETATAAVLPEKEPPPEKSEPPAPPAETPPLLETPPMIAEVVLPPPRPPQHAAAPKAQKHRQRLADLNSAPPQAERTAPRAVAPAPGAATADPHALANWKSELVARLERAKRYPGEAQARGDEGIAQLAFSVDRSGGVHNARIVRSSGSSLLDRATLDLIARAQPLPAPPPGMHGAQIAIVVPINYNLTAAR